MLSSANMVKIRAIAAAVWGVWHSHSCLGALRTVALEARMAVHRQVLAEEPGPWPAS